MGQQTTFEQAPQIDCALSVQEEFVSAQVYLFWLGMSFFAFSS